MTLKSRFTLFTVFWLIFILILYNVFVYYFVIRVTTQGELQLISNRIETVLETLRQNPDQEISDPKLLADHYNPNEMMRIVLNNGQVANIIGRDQELLSLPILDVSKAQTDMIQHNGSRIVHLSVPVYEKGNHTATIEAVRRLTMLDSYLQILLGALSVTSIGAIVFAIFGTYWFTAKLTGPINQMVHTMREIDRSGKLHRVKLASREESVELQQMVRAFNQMIERLDRTFEHQKQFVADASHELKTPLTVISSYVDMLQRWGKDKPEIRDEAIEAIARETERMQILIRSMLTLTEAEQATWMNMSRFDIVPITQDLSSVLGTTFGREIRVHARQPTIHMKADKDKIRQLLLILLDNAIKYSKEAIDVRIVPMKSGIKLEVTDYGIGVPENEIPYLFDRFYRVDEARHRSTGGSGLGLSIAKKIIDLHNGKVDVYSKVGNGTTISILFPNSYNTRRAVT